MRLGKRELAVLQTALSDYALSPARVKGEAAFALKLREKLEGKAAAPGAARVGVDAGPIHDALVASAGGKVAPMTEAGAAWWARASRQWADLQATTEQAKRIGHWLANQAWMTGTVSWSGVFNKWGEWHARATAEFGGSSASPGSSDGQGTQTGRRKESW